MGRREMKKIGWRFPIILSVAFTLCGCVHLCADYAMHAEVSGDVVDEATSQPVVCAAVTFVDLDLSNIPAPERTRIPLGQTDRDGRIEACFSYRWARQGYVFVWQTPRHSRDMIGIEISGAGYHPSSKEFSVELLPWREDGTTYINIGMVKLRRIAGGGT